MQYLTIEMGSGRCEAGSEKQYTITATRPLGQYCKSIREQLNSEGLNEVGIKKDPQLPGVLPNPGVNHLNVQQGEDDRKQSAKDPKRQRRHGRELLDQARGCNSQQKRHSQSNDSQRELRS